MIFWVTLYNFLFTSIHEWRSFNGNSKKICTLRFDKVEGASPKFIQINGRVVNDLLRVKKDVIWTCNVSATQEIDKIQQEHVQKIQDLENTVQQQQTLINSLLARVQALENA